MGKKRESNLELYRIIVMILIIAHHFVVNSFGLWDKMKLDPISLDSTFFYILGMWGKAGINCFVLITGYFMCESKITIQKFLKLYLEIVFYCLLLYVFQCIYYSNFSFTNLLWCFFPIKGISTNFMGCFLIFYLIIPFLTIIYNNINRKNHQYLILLLMSCYVILPLQTKYNVVMNYVSWFCVLFFIASYIKRYKLYKEENSKLWCTLTLVSMILSILSVMGVVYVTSGEHAYYLIGEVNRPMAILTSICSFIYFKNLKISYNRFINIIASTTFGVFLVHTRLNTFLWRDLINVSEYYEKPLFAIVIILIVFCSCSVIDIVRVHTIEKWIINNIKIFK